MPTLFIYATRYLRRPNRDATRLRIIVTPPGSPQTPKVAIVTMILVADDDQSTRDLVGALLRKAGHEVTEATDGDFAYMQATVSKPDLIILDIMMPGIDGWEVLSRLRNDPETWEIPIVMLSAKTGLEEVSKSISLGAVEVISKPCEPAQIVNAVRANLPTASR
jgi:CheY-like chemotaxis protein